MPEAKDTGNDDGKEDVDNKSAPAKEKNGGLPSGVRPVFFSAAGQQLFECVVESDVTAENPHKLIKKEVILEDFKNRAAVSDFHPVKKDIQVKINNS